MTEYIPLSIETLFEEDPLGNLGRKLESVHKEWEDRFKPYKHVSEAYHEIGSDNVLRERIREVWDTMHRLVTLGQGFDGKGRLECSKEECRIVVFQ